MITVRPSSRRRATLAASMSTSVTSHPASARRNPKVPPMAPAPTIAILRSIADPPFGPPSSSLAFFPLGSPPFDEGLQTFVGVIGDHELVNVDRVGQLQG